MTQTPKFHFYPNAYEDGCLGVSEGPCPVCGRTDLISYRSTTYGTSTKAVECPCVLCIANGQAAAAAGIDQDWPEYDADSELYCRLGAFNSISSHAPISRTDEIEEVLNRTPSPNTWQQFDWPLHGDEPMIFEGFVDYASAESDAKRLEALVAACPRQDVEWCKTCVTIGGDIGVLMFRSTDGSAFTGILDAS